MTRLIASYFLRPGRTLNPPQFNHICPYFENRNVMTPLAGGEMRILILFTLRNRNTPEKK
ncbi:hypothetical protein OUZ56_015095 [Daphnia magna]|uniref:Uncharacterized protein n=1 Tax=Daphnia magna TaxID=35525 RepID=A0ABR0ALR5_9CRUS|nr:hypothetical protein OUZ56_015095 [Daphnia magna]